MEAEQTVSSVYRSIIDDVVARVKPEFVGDGVDECALALPDASALAGQPLHGD